MATDNRCGGLDYGKLIAAFLVVAILWLLLALMLILFLPG